MRTKVTKRVHSLFVKSIDSSKPITIDENGRRWLPITGWNEVAEINLGSIRNPNKEILEFKIEPIKIEPSEVKKISSDDFFSRFFGE